MKKTWKCWLATLAACALSFHNAWAQESDSYSGSVGVANTGSDIGTVQLGNPGVRTAKADPPGVLDPERIFDDAPPVIEDTFVPMGGGIGFANTRSLDDIVWRVGRTNLERLGFDGGYTNIDAFVPIIIESDRALWWVSPQANIGDNQRGGANIGVGRNVYDPAQDRVYGASFWWNYDAIHRSTYNALGGSFESIGQFFSLRSNFLLPVGRQYHDFNVTFGNPQFVGNQVTVDRMFTRETAYQYYDVEAASPIPGLGRYGFDIGLGFYYLSAVEKSSVNRDSPGFSLRLQSQVTEDFWIQGLLTTDDIYGARFSLNMELTMPDGMPSRWFRRKPVSEYLTASYIRYGRVPVAQQQQSETIMATGGSDGSALSIAFVDPNALVPGDGSQTMPFMSLADYMSHTAAERSEFDVIYVLRRNDATDTNLNTTISLLDFQTLVGDGDLPNGGRPTITTDQGMISLPGTFGPLPVISNSAVASGTPVVTLADANEVSGIVIDGGGTGPGIVGNGIDSFNIHDTTIQNVTSGIRITSDTTPVLGIPGENYGIIENNTITSSTGLRNASLAGISITHTDGTLDLLVRNNDVSGFRGEDANGNGMLDLTEDTNGNGVLDVGEDRDGDGMLDLSEDVNGNSILDRGVGIEVVANGGTINAALPSGDPVTGARPTGILSNTLDMNANGISVLSNPGSVINLALNDNVVTNGTDPNGNGIEVISDGGTINLISAMNNRVGVAAPGAISFGNGFVLINRNMGVLNIGDPLSTASPFVGNILQNTSGDGLQIIVDNTDLTIEDLSGFTFANNLNDGVNIQALNGATLTITNPITDNIFANNGNAGLEITSSASTVDLLVGATANISGTLNIFGNEFTGNGTGAIFTTLDGGTIDTAFVGNTVTGSVGDGVVINANSGVIDFTGRTVVMTDANGNQFTLRGTGIQHNTITGNGLNGMTIASSNGGQVLSPFVSDNNFSNNTAAGLLITGTGSTVGPGIINLGSVTRNMFNRTTSGTAGLLFDSQDSNIIMTLTRNQFIGGGPFGGANPGPNQNTSFGIGGTVTGGSLDLDIGTPNVEDTNLFQDNVDAHVAITLAGDATGDINILNSVFSNATDNPNTPFFFGDGVVIRVHDTAVLTGTVQGSMFDNNAGDGLRLEVAGDNDAGNDQTLGAFINDFVIGGTADGTGNIFSNNGNNGLAIARTERGQVNNMLIQGNLFTNNGTVDLRENAASVDIARELAGDSGLYIQAVGANQLNLPNQQPDTYQILQNTFTDNTNNGISFLIGADGDIYVDIDQNLIDGNGTFIDNNAIGFVEGDADFRYGNGIEVSKQIRDAKDSRSITGRWTRNQITNNINDGIQLDGLLGNVLNDPEFIAGSDTTDPNNSFGLIIGSTEINEIGVFNDMGNLISENGGDGVEVVGGGTVTIGNNIITLNGTPSVFNVDVNGNGLAAAPANGPLQDAQFNGVPLLIHAGINIEGFDSNDSFSLNGTTDSQVDDFSLKNFFQDVNIFSNFINSNNGDGIEFLAEGGAPGFDWQQFTGDPAIFEAPDEDNPLAMPFDILDTQKVTIRRNEITANDGRGIDVLVRPGDFEVLSNQAGSMVTAAGQAGFGDTLDSDNLDGSHRDSFQLVRNAVFADVSIIENHIKGNRLEGVYVVTTADAGTNQVLPSFLTPGDNDGAGPDVPDGGVAAVYELRFDFHGNQVVANGIDVIEFPATGLVMRVGTVNGGYGIDDTGGFATSGFNSEDVNGNGLLDAGEDLNGDGYINAEEITPFQIVTSNVTFTGLDISQLGGVSASVTNNLFDGNFGDDILFSDFRSTYDPPQLTGTWNTMQFGPITITGTDQLVFGVPLARMDLIFSENRFNSIEANNEDDTVGALGEPSSFYDFSNDTVFRRRTGPPTDPPGPFGGGTQFSNARRQASRWLTNPPGLPPFPGQPVEARFFLYPGMGDSTFRVRGADNFFTDQGLTQADGVSPVDIEDIFILDQPQLFGSPFHIDDFSEARGVLAPFGALPWGWGTF